MLLKYFYDKPLAQASYMIGCQRTREAVVIDPMRNITPYLLAAAEEGLTITHVTETHIHADFVSGVRELAAQTGARIVVSAEGGADWQYGYGSDQLLHDGDVFRVGLVEIRAMHTPGHTPEHLCFLVTDTANADRPMGIFTGDCVFVGDLGRPDLLETAAGVVGAKEIGAAGQWQNVLKFRELPDYLQLYPGHGAGSACGKALGAVPTSTVGYEKMFNPAFQFRDEASFVRWLLTDQPETPRYFGHMKRINREGPPLIDSLPSPQPLEGFVLGEMIKSGANVIDARMMDETGSWITGAVRIPPDTQFNTYAGWVVNFEQPTYLIAEEDAVRSLIAELRAVGIDQVLGYFTPDVVESSEGFIAQTDTDGARTLIDQGAFVLDVRGANEFSDGHIEGAVNIPYGMLAARAAELPRETPLLVHCQSGVRSLIAASILDNLGFTNVINVVGGYDAWQRANQAVIG